MTRNHLALADRVYSRTWQDGKYLRRPESHYLDFVVDGAPLRDRFPDSGDLVTELNRAWLPGVGEAVEVLLGRKPHPRLGPDRVPLLVCGVCGSLDCGVLTARLTVTEAEVRWSEWRWVSYESESDTDTTVVAGGVEPFTFDRTSYDAALNQSVDRLADMPYDELAHIGKRFLWPWEWGWRLP
ncbi:MAG TPA: hypothetical protein VFY84_06075 [Jiangellales bacterium]|nr:hypothetical protein [Jiangellales bacterium]